jgi:hypothetical protein
MERIVGSEVSRGGLEPLGVIPIALGGPASSQFQRAELAKWAKAVRDGNVKVD